MTGGPISRNAMDLSGHTKPFAVLGHPIGHSLSPVMHNASLRALKMDAVYLAFDVHPDRLMTVLESMRDMGFGGVNLTVPLKETAFKGVAEMDDSARRLGAVNTVEFLQEGGMKGHNTDGAGFILAVKEAFDTSPEGKSVFLLGAGGAGRAVALTCAACGASGLNIADIDSRRAEGVRDDILSQATMTPCAVSCVPDRENWPEACAAADLVVQATPVGMRQSDGSLLETDAFREGQMVFDLIYMYPETALMKTARSAGARVANGLGMLLHQGSAAFTIWTGLKADDREMRKALEKKVYG